MTTPSLVSLLPLLQLRHNSLPTSTFRYNNAIVKGRILQYTNRHVKGTMREGITTFSRMLRSTFLLLNVSTVTLHNRLRRILRLTNSQCYREFLRTTSRLQRSTLIGDNRHNVTRLRRGYLIFHFRHFVQVRYGTILRYLYLPTSVITTFTRIIRCRAINTSRAMCRQLGKCDPRAGLKIKSRRANLCSVTLTSFRLRAIVSRLRMRAIFHRLTERRLMLVISNRRERSEYNSFRIIGSIMPFQRRHANRLSNAMVR